MLTAPAHDLGAAGWVGLVVLVLGSETLVLRAALTGLRMLLRFLERRRRELRADAAGARSEAADADWIDVTRLVRFIDPSPRPRPLVHVRQGADGTQRDRVVFTADDFAAVGS